MATLITLKRRIGSVKSTRQITKAMELVSASKLRRAQEQALLSRDYRQLAYSLLARLGSIQEVETHPLFQPRKVKSKLYIIVTSNGGLAGAYNSNVLKQFTADVKTDRASNIATHVIVIGNQGANFVRRLEAVNLLAFYPAFGDEPTANDIRPILNTLLEQYKEAKVDEVRIVYTMFKTSLVQQVISLSILPATITEEEQAHYKYSFTNFEPSVDAVINSIATRLIEVQIWQATLESLASEHSMRMVAMKNATDNAGEIIDDLTLEFNTARQANITQELAEISGGVEALKD